MPLNLPPEALKAEEQYRAAGSVAEKIARLEEFLSTIPKHKGTDRLRASLRKKLSKLKSSSPSSKKSSRQESAYHIDKEGAGQVVIIGPGNAGKSALVAALTNAAPEVANYPFTTWQPTPGMMLIENVQVQLIDTPSLDRDYVEPELLNMIRRADFVLLVVDLQAHPIQQIEETIAFLEEHRIAPSHLKGRYDEQRHLIFVPLLVLVNKHDDESFDEDFEIFCELLEGEWSLLSISATTCHNFERLKWLVFEQLSIMRVYSKAPGKEPDLSAPFVLEKESTVEEFARKVHQDFAKNLKTARVWGNGVYDGQMVGRDHVLNDGDVVELRT